MNNAMCVQIFDCIADLNDIVFDFLLHKFFSSSEQLVEGLVLAEFEQNINILRSFKIVFKLDDVLMKQRPVDLYLTNQLLLLSRFGQGDFIHNFRCRKMTQIIAMRELIASSKAALP